MIMSVSTLIIGNGAATPVSLSNFCMAVGPRERSGRVMSRRPIDDKRAGDQVVQRLLAPGEASHDEADHQDGGGEILGDGPQRRPPKSDAAAVERGDLDRQRQFAERA